MITCLEGAKSTPISFIPPVKRIASYNVFYNVRVSSPEHHHGKCYLPKVADMILLVVKIVAKLSKLPNKEVNFHPEGRPPE